MYGPGGTAYVYLIYGMYNQFNVVTNVEDIPDAGAGRAEPVKEFDVIRRRRRGRSKYQLTEWPRTFCLCDGDR